MSKDLEEVRWPSAIAIEEINIRYLEGRLLTLLESLGLPETQEQAIKGLVRDEVWRLPEFGCYVPPKIYTELRLEQSKLGEQIVR